MKIEAVFIQIAFYVAIILVCVYIGLIFNTPRQANKNDIDYIEYRFNKLENRISRMKVNLEVKKLEDGGCVLYPVVE